MIHSHSKPTWMRIAACVDAENVDIFFDETHRKKVNAAKKICRACPSMQQCLEYAIRHQEHGVWGATTTNERAKFMRATRRIAQSTD